MSGDIGDVAALLLALLQGLALGVLIVRLLAARPRNAPVQPAGPLDDTTVSVVLPTLDEARRVGPCLDGLARQAAPLAEIIVVDSRSTDGTPALVLRAAGRDRRVVLVEDPPPPRGWIGKPWALQHGLGLSRSEWVLGMDADVEPQPGMVAGAVTAARAARLEVVSFAPRFAAMTAGEQWLQPSMLLTILYRFAGGGGGIGDVLANGQCFLARRETLLRNGGYEVARASWSEDVTLARHLARRGVRVGFLDGSRLFRVRSYAGMWEMWREWGRSFDLSDATPPRRRWMELAFILLVQGLPVPLLLMGAAGAAFLSPLLIAVNAATVAIRVAMLRAIRGSYERRAATWWLSPLSDPLAAATLAWRTFRRPRRWRGRNPAPGP